MTILTLPYTTPPLTENQRLHHMQRARIVKQIRHDTCLLAYAGLQRHCQHITVTLHYTPRDRRRRDADNLVPTLKAACDGLVDAHIVEDDTPAWMTKRMPVIEPPDPRATHRLWLDVQITEDAS